jgi:rhodanese-related sulfurtransferase
MGLLRRLPTISPREAAERLSRGELQLVDVREAAEVATGAVPEATHIPLGRLPGEMTKQLDGARPVAFVCRSGGRSAAATRAALAAGLDASNVSGGMTAWARQGLPMTTEEAR